MLKVVVWQFLFCIALYLFGLTGLDRMVTSVIKPDIDRQTFLAYCLWQTLLNQTTALMSSLMYLYCTPNASLQFALLLYFTVLWCWAGGTLDFLYFMMKGQIPEWSHIWHWIPIKPKTWQFAIYACVWLIYITAAWAYTLSTVSLV